MIKKTISDRNDIDDNKDNSTWAMPANAHVQSLLPVIDASDPPSNADTRATLKKNSAILNQRKFRGLKKGFVREVKLKNSFVDSTKLEKDFDF